jgi:predicted DNA-binding transcriptional regulator YafY
MPSTDQALLRLALALQGTSQGLSIAEMMTRIGELQGKKPVSRKTAERYRDALRDTFPQLKESKEVDGLLRYSIPAGILNRHISISALELAELHLATTRARQEGQGVAASTLAALETKLRALLPDKLKTKIGNELEDLLEAEGFAMRPMPRPEIDTQILGLIREALMKRVTIELTYQSRRGGTLTEQEVEPAGLLFGIRHYLVAFGVTANKPYPHNYALGHIKSIMLTNRSFVPRDGFDLRAYAERSFGVYQDQDVSAVTWIFAPDRASDVMEFQFHPTEQKELLPDGSVKVTFTAGGLREMAWHLFTWGKSVRVVGPEALQSQYRALLQEALSGLDAPSGEKAG